MENFEKLTISLLMATLLVISFNALQISRLSSQVLQAPLTTTLTAKAAAASQPIAEPAKSALDLDIIPKGIPRIYGKELGISYDDVSSASQKKTDETIKKLGTLDEQIALSGKELERYIAIASQISCEYCCGVDSIIFPDGKPACSCQHSFAMRGLAKYLIKNHGSEYTNNEILEELGKWKTLFFPSPMAKKAVVLKVKGIELNYINLASNKYRGIENGN